MILRSHTTSVPSPVRAVTPGLLEVLFCNPCFLLPNPRPGLSLSPEPKPLSPSQRKHVTTERRKPARPGPAQSPVCGLQTCLLSVWKMWPLYPGPGFLLPSPPFLPELPFIMRDTLSLDLVQTARGALPTSHCGESFECMRPRPGGAGTLLSSAVALCVRRWH